MKSLQMLRAARDSTVRSAQVVLRDVGNGLLEISHNSLALLGLAVVVVLVFVAGRPDLRHQTEVWALDWLQERHEARSAADDDLTVAAAEPDAVERAMAVNPKELTPQQAALAKWISRRYNVALEPIGRLVQESWAIGQAVGLDPTLILAIAAIESRFNPFAQSAIISSGTARTGTTITVGVGVSGDGPLKHGQHRRRGGSTGRWPHWEHKGVQIGSLIAHLNLSAACTIDAAGCRRVRNRAVETDHFAQHERGFGTAPVAGDVNVRRDGQLPTEAEQFIDCLQLNDAS